MIGPGGTRCGGEGWDEGSGVEGVISIGDGRAGGVRVVVMVVCWR